MPRIALDDVEPSTDSRFTTAKEGHHVVSNTVGSAFKCTMVALLILLWMPLHVNSKSTHLKNVETSVKPHYNRSTFCVENQLLPSFFVIGVQKCGTSTLDAVLRQFRGFSHGQRKEHHFFDLMTIMTKHVSEYLHQFPSCKSNFYKTFDATPGYTNPNYTSAENIRALYEKWGLPLEDVRFIAMVCRNAKRLPSAYYHHNRGKHWDRVNNMGSNFNMWFEYIMSNQAEERSGILQRGFYDEIFLKYFETFPKSMFLLIDIRALQDQQTLGDAIAVFLNVQNQPITTISKHVSRLVKEELTKSNTATLEQFYDNHETAFLNIVKHQRNVKTFPLLDFFAKA